MGRLSKAIIFLALLIALLSGFSSLIEDWLWFTDLGYPQLFWTPLLSKWLIQIVNGTILFIFIAGTLLSIRHSIITFVNDKLRNQFRLVHDMNRPVLSLSQNRFTLWLIVISAIVSFGISFVSGFTGWLDVLSFFHSQQFGKNDPIFSKDLSFYIFKLPFYKTLYNAFYGPLFLLTILTGAFYIVTGVLKFHSPRLWRKNALEIGIAGRRHLAILMTVLFAFLTFGFFLDIYQLLYSTNGHVIGAGYTDLYAVLPALKLLIVLSSIGFLAAILGIASRDSRLLSLPVGTILIVGFLTYGIFPGLVQSFIVNPNELVKESPYIEKEIEMTQFAYRLDKIKELDYSGNTQISTETLKANQATLNNIRLNDTRPMLQTYTQKQGIRLYYKFNDIDIDRYSVNGEYRQVMLAARELSTPDLDSKAKTFINLRFKYTHGFGATASFANAVTPEGLPAFVVKDVPPVTNYPELKLSEPRIYYGELTNDWVVVNTTHKEFDYPQGTTNAENNYEGKTGLKFTSFNKLISSFTHGTFRFYLSREITNESKILLHRNIRERVQKLAPFLKYDSDPYMVIDNGRIKWIIDAYTVASTMPYASPYSDQDFNYIRNSVKVVVDGYDGTVDFYISDENDPVIRTYQSVFPEVFKSLTNMPTSLRSHLRYPETMFKIQSNMLKTFHMKNPTVFYNKEDSWDIAKELFETTPQSIDPYYTVMMLPGEEKPEFILMIPFTPASSATNTRNNMVAWLAARMDGDNYGQLLLYKLPKNIEIDGPLQIESRIDQDPEISRQLSLWDQKGSSVIRGNLLTLPLGGNFLYIEPIYLQSDKGGSIPEMKRVVVAYENRLIMTETLGEALIEIFGIDSPHLTTPGQTAQIPPPIPKSSEPIKPSDQNISQLLNQIDQIRSMLESLENQLKGLQTKY